MVKNRFSPHKNSNDKNFSKEESKNASKFQENMNYRHEDISSKISSSPLVERS